METLTRIWYALSFQLTENDTTWNPTLLSLTVWALIIIFILVLYWTADSDFDFDFD